MQLAALSGLALGLSGPAHAVDGCKLLLCMAGNWKNISQCEPTVRQALRDVARGRGWPTCSMSGSSGTGNQYVAPEQCPEQYRTISGTDDNGRVIYSWPLQWRDPCRCRGTALVTNLVVAVGGFGCRVVARREVCLRKLAGLDGRQI